MARGVEEEVKLAFESVEAARTAVIRAGGRLDVSRRLLDDRLYDTPEGRLRDRRSAVRLRREPGRAYLTFKGPVLPGAVKRREEIELEIREPDAMHAVLEALGYASWWRYQKHREEHVIEEARIAVDETPIGVFVEIEGSPDAIARVAAGLGRSASAYVLDSYRMLYVKWCDARGVTPGDMVFP